MSLHVWPPVPAHELAAKAQETLEREIEWAIAQTVKGCQEIEDGLEECYALLAPIDQGVVLPVTSPKSEMLKGTLTRIGTRITKGRLVLNLKTIGRAEFDIDPSRDIHLPALETVHRNINSSLESLAALTTPSTTLQASKLSRGLQSLSRSLSTSIALLVGNPSQDRVAWQSASCPTDAFNPDLGRHLSLHLTIRDAYIWLTVRALESAEQPLHFGTRLGLAFGTVRRLEHDEVDRKFEYAPLSAGSVADPRHAHHEAGSSYAGQAEEPAHEVYVREKVVVDAADPKLISLLSKLRYLSNRLNALYRNLQAAMGEDAIE